MKVLGLIVSVTALTIWLLAPHPVLGQDAVIIDMGIDTFLVEAGPFGNEATWHWWEFDLVNRGAETHALLWFDIPQNVLNSFGAGTATLKLHLNDHGDAGKIHPVIVDWVSDLGNDVTWNNMPGGPGLSVGDNLSESFVDWPATFGLQGTVVEVDVSEHVQAWAAGEPNYGWGILPMDGNGTNIASFESEPTDFFDPVTFDPAPKLELVPGEPTAGDRFDCNGDGTLTVRDVNCAAPESVNQTLVAANLITGDADGHVGFADFLILSSNFAMPGQYTDGDFDSDGEVQFSDFLILSQNFGQSSTVAAAVPEPSTVVLALLGVLGMLTRCRS